MPKATLQPASREEHHPYRQRPEDGDANDTTPVLLHPDVVSVIGDYVGCPIRSLQPETRPRFSKDTGIAVRKELEYVPRDGGSILVPSESGVPVSVAVNIRNADGTDRRRFKVGDFVLCPGERERIGIGEIKRMEERRTPLGKRVVVAVLQIYLHGSDTILGDCADPKQIYQTTREREVNVVSLSRRIAVNTGQPDSLVCEFGWHDGRNAFVDREALADGQQQVYEAGNFVRFTNGECTTCPPLKCIGQIQKFVSPDSFEVGHLCRLDSVLWEKARQVVMDRIRRLRRVDDRRVASAEDNLKLSIEEVFAEWRSDNKAVFPDGQRWVVGKSCIAGPCFVLDWQSLRRAGRHTLGMVREHPDAMFVPSPSEFAKLDYEQPPAHALLPDDKSTRFLQDMVSRTKSMQDKPVAVWDLCCSAGILGAGFHRTPGFKVAFACDIDKVAVEVYKRNFQTTALACSISQLLVSHPKYPSKDSPFAICAGVPCQGYSGCNVYKKYEDPRNLVVFELLSLIRKAQEKRAPDFVLLECVPGMLTHRNAPTSSVERSGELLRFALRLFLEFGYQVSVNVLNTNADGLPQTRQRLFVWAALKGQTLPAHESALHLSNSGLFRIGSHQLTPRRADAALARPTSNDEAISDLPLIKPEDVVHRGGHRQRYFGYLTPQPYRYKPRCNLQLLLRGDAELAPDHFGRTLSLETHADILTRNQAIQRRYRTVLTRNLQIQHREDRPLSVLELRRLQGIPDDHWLGEYDSRYLTFVGNAVPFPTAKARARELLNACWDQQKRDASDARQT